MEDSTLTLNRTFATVQQEKAQIHTPYLSGTIAPPIQVALFGGGRWGTHLLRNFLELPQAQVVAVVDPFVERLEQLSRQFSLGDRENAVLLTTDWREAMGLRRVNAVAIATPAATHYGLIKEALQAGLHVLAEKPLTLDPAESWELCHLAQQQQRQLVIDHTYLFNPVVQRGKAAIQEALLGGLRYGYADRTHLGPIRQDVDALWDLAIHDIAIFNYWLNESPIQVQAQGTVWLQPKADPQQFLKGLSDLVWVRLTYPSGFQAFIHLCWSNPDKQRRLCVVGDRGSLIFDELMQDAPLTFQQGRLESVDEQFIPVDQCCHILEYPKMEPLQEVCRHFLNCVQENQPSQISSGELGASLVQVLSALTRSLNQGGQVVEV
ncbi:MAG: Gfo/Idh/MocA family oxidoreductase [Oculatellaceae cyanobacterium Prado106]|jgi:predicted dehydrogenase|nr:Gfo/Idh/MocA family oxidoreductase [Oculatellaceae cyanobacterium Prado106]